MKLKELIELLTYQDDLQKRDMEQEVVVDVDGVYGQAGAVGIKTVEYVKTVSPRLRIVVE